MVSATAFLFPHNGMNRRAQVRSRANRQGSFAAYLFARKIDSIVTTSIRMPKSVKRRSNVE
jgi:hypothetical protein